MNNKQRDVAMRYIVDQAEQAAATAHYAVLAMRSMINNETVPDGVTKKGPAAVFRYFRERHKPLKESSFYGRPDGSIGCHRDDHHEAKAERHALRVAVAHGKGEKYRGPGVKHD